VPWTRSDGLLIYSLSVTEDSIAQLSSVSKGRVGIR
jgi:hypothetical protein